MNYQEMHTGQKIDALKDMIEAQGKGTIQDFLDAREQVHQDAIDASIEAKKPKRVAPVAA